MTGKLPFTDVPSEAPTFYKDEPVWDTIRNDARYADLLRRMNLPG
ncbi:MAG TPA: hypothetical protein VFZ23_13175 [Pyrinomonadaceae bacterium]